jgi:hypothetical protein
MNTRPFAPLLVLLNQPARAMIGAVGCAARTSRLPGATYGRQPSLRTRFTASSQPA